MPSNREAFLLAGVGGCIDAIGLLTLGGLFVSHMSGNTATFGAMFSQGNWSAGAPHLFAVPVFLAGLFLGYLWVGKSPSNRRCAALFLIEAGLLTAFGLGLWVRGELAINSPGYFLLVTPALLAMGLQNSTLREIRHSTFPSTYVTGVLDRLAKSAATSCREREGPEAAAKKDDAIAALCVWLSYVAGAIGGGAGVLFFQHLILLIPIGLLIFLAVHLVRRGT